MEWHHCQVIIVGSGPAGTTAALYASRGGLTPLVRDGMHAGPQLTIATEFADEPGFPEEVLGPELMTRMHPQAERWPEVLLTCGAIIGLVTTTAIAVLLHNESRGVGLGTSIVIGAIIRPGVAATLVALDSRALSGERFIRHVLRATDLGTSIVAGGGFISAAPKLRSARQAR